MTQQQRQRLVNAGFSRKGLADAQFILDRMPTAKHDAVIATITTPLTSAVRRLTSTKFVTFDDGPTALSEDVMRELMTRAVREEATEAINRITGRVH